MCEEPLRIAYSLEEIRAKLTPWMVAEFGNPREIEDCEERSRWHERNGLIHHFLICHFPDGDGRVFGGNDALTRPAQPGKGHETL